MSASCYVSCSPPTTGIAPVVPHGTFVAHAAASSGLPFTGADIGEMAVLGLLLVIGGAVALLSGRGKRGARS